MKKETKLMKNKNNKILDIIFIVILILLSVLFVSLLVQKVNHQIPNLFGFYLSPARDESMAPIFYAGDVIISKNTTKEDLKVGDIITYKNTKDLIETNRIVEIISIENNECYITKSDEDSDLLNAQMVTKDSVISKYIFKISLF